MVVTVHMMVEIESEEVEGWKGWFDDTSQADSGV